MLDTGLGPGDFDVPGNRTRPAFEPELLDDRVTVVVVGPGQFDVRVDVFPLVGRKREAELGAEHAHLIQQDVDDGLLQLGQDDASGLLAIAICHVNDSYLGHDSTTPVGQVSVYATCAPSNPTPGTPAEKSTCLLYTSPSPRDVEESRMPSSA